MGFGVIIVVSRRGPHARPLAPADKRVRRRQSLNKEKLQNSQGSTRKKKRCIPTRKAKEDEGSRQAKRNARDKPHEQTTPSQIKRSDRHNTKKNAGYYVEHRLYRTTV